MAETILVLAEQWKGSISDITYELLALGRELAGALGAPLEAVLIGANTKVLAPSLGGADTVLCVDDPSLADAAPDTVAAALAQVIKMKQPRCLLVPLTNISMDIGLLTAAQLPAPYVNFCRDIRVADGALEAQSVLYGGKMEATVAVTAQPTILGVWPGARPADQGRVDRQPATAAMAVTLPAAGKVRFKRYIEPEAGDVDITQQDVLVAVGRGIQTKDNLDLAEELAGTLGGAVCGSRPVIDQGWLGLTRQVGKSGVIVKPKAYFAFGISGAPEHVEGMKDAGMIVAVNTDPQAPIFNVAHYGVVGDVLDVIPAMTEAIKTARG
jgi:electron transfer flavoprotein alpha subunit